MLFVVCCDLSIVCFLTGGVCAVLCVVSWKAWAFGPWPQGRQSNTKARNSKQHLTCGCGEESHPPKRSSSHLSSRGGAEGHKCDVLCILLTPTVALKSCEKKAYQNCCLPRMDLVDRHSCPYTAAAARQQKQKSGQELFAPLSLPQES